ncbi:MAG: hypothetical protein CMG08_06360 [Candidatus Marinimicrobia bacterium]|nr:hypothetical protein [Candidatus Neomarinimicrobiota bacterium]|tara:strand:+ start:427 stop:636 length:210 start_codon:yes stop_codon:yes gene_type:complete
MGNLSENTLLFYIAGFISFIIVALFLFYYSYQMAFSDNNEIANISKRIRNITISIFALIAVSIAIIYLN